ncbi:MAG TPA: FG-GAP repeat protein, partial [Pyrinomonadaceae bacterium]|nr:FG-GAP repeat protein [Pyrinomonadaceae bacterium]
MFKHLITNPHKWTTRLLFAIGLAGCLTWPMFWRSLQTGPQDHAANKSPAEAQDHQSEGNRQVGVPLQIQGAEALKYLEQAGEGMSLNAALTAARYSINKVDRGSPQGDSATYESLNPAQSLNAQFSARGVRVQSTTRGNWQVNLRLKSYGYGKDLPPLISGDMRAEGNRIEISKHAEGSSEAPTLTEWYENRSDGLEQGFTVSAQPKSTRAGRSRTKLQLSLELTGDLQGELATDRKSIRLKNAGGEHVASYSHLAAWDAHGLELPAQFHLQGREVNLEVDDAGATYPLTIDPTFQQEILLTATSGGPVTNFFGSEVAISGSTAVVADKSQINPGLGLRNGAVYVFVRNGATWTQQQKLIPDIADPGPGLGLTFGFSVAISGNTIIVGAVGSDQNRPPFTQHGHAFIFIREG